MEEMNINTDVTGAEQCLLDDTNFNPVEQHNKEPNSPLASQASFHKDLVLAVLEDLPRDESENALSEVQSPLFIHAAALTVSSENLLVPKETVNGPVSHPASPTSSVNEDGVSLTARQSAGQHKDPSTAAQEPSQPAVSTHATDVAHSNDLSHSINEVPTSDSPVSCEMQNTSDNDLKVDSSLAAENELCKDTKSKLEKEEDVKLPAEVSETTDIPLLDNCDLTRDSQQGPVVNNEEVTEKPQIVRTEKRRKRKMDVSQITRYNPEDIYNDLNDSPMDADLLDMDRLKQSDELLIVGPAKYSLMKVKSEPMFDEFGVSYSEEIVETVEDYRYSPASRFIDSSPNDFSHADDDQVYNKSSDPEAFYPCTKCNVNFREKKHLHRHMMYHLDGNNHFRHLNVPRPYACKECGRTFRDQTSRLKHMEIHQERRERLMDEIRELRELQDEGRTARLQCPQCVFGTNCPKTFVQHAKTHEKDKQYYCCDECTFMAVSERELECHRSIAHRAKMKRSLLDFEMSQRKAQRKLSERSTFLLPSKKSPVFMCNLCPFNTSAQNILRKHMEYLHPASCTDQLDGRILDGRESELLDFGSQAKQFLKQSTFPKNSVLKQDLKRPYDSSSHTSGFKLFPRKQYNFQITKGDTQTARYFAQSSPNKTILVKNDQTHGYFNQIAKQRANYKMSSGYLYKQECERYGRSKTLSQPYSINLKREEGNPTTSERLLSNQGKIQHNGVILDTHNVYAKRSDSSGDHNRAAIQGVKKIKREETDAEEDLGNYSEFLDLLQKFDPSENKESFDTEDETSWGNGELGDNVAKPKEDKVSNKANRPHSEADPPFGNVNDEKIVSEGNQSSQFKEDFYFEYYDDPEDRFLHELNADEHLDGVETGLPNHNSVFDWADLSLEKKNCPYCPAIFETGVGLSNHVRGHLHRAGLTYEARHVVSPERIVTSDKVQRFKRIATPIKRIRKAIEKSETSEHTCQLCGGWFDTKIGLSNHVRGHLKRLGKTKWDAQKSPICILNEMLQDEEKCEKILKALNTRHVLHRPFSARKLASGEDFSATALPLEAHHNGLHTEGTSAQMLKALPLSPGLNGIKSDLGGEPSHTLIELLKNKQLAGCTSLDNSPQKNQGQTARKRFNQKCVLPINEDCTLMYQPRTAVDFSVVECKQKRSRSGSKKKGLPLPHSADEVYILRCRFCGLVFKGPLSVQEDWIKHLQRHIVNANLPRTGAGMVEIPSLLKKPPSISETSYSLLVAEAAS